MADDSSTSMFGDDINSTPLSKLGIGAGGGGVPSMTVTSRKDEPPLAPPMYTADVPGLSGAPQPQHQQHQPKHVSFDTQDYVQEIPGRHQTPRQQPQYRRVSRGGGGGGGGKKKKLVAFVSAYAHPLTVAVLMVVVLWYYPQAARLPYASHAGYLTTLGILGVGVASAVTYGVVEHIVD